MGIEPEKYIAYVHIVDEALTYCTKIQNAKSIPRLIKQRIEFDGKFYEQHVDKQYYTKDEKRCDYF